jgi:hypothetical protein
MTAPKFFEPKTRLGVKGHTSPPEQINHMSVARYNAPYERKRASSRLHFVGGCKVVFDQDNNSMHGTTFVARLQFPIQLIGNFQCIRI